MRVEHEQRRGVALIPANVMSQRELAGVAGEQIPADGQNHVVKADHETCVDIPRRPTAPRRAPRTRAGTSRGGERAVTGSGLEERVANDLAKLVGECLPRSSRPTAPSRACRVVGDLDGLRDVLVDQQDGHAGGLTSRSRSRPGRRCGRQPCRRLVDQEQARRRHEPFATESISPRRPRVPWRGAGAFPPGAGTPCRRARASPPPARDRAEDPRPDLEVFLDRELRKDVRACGRSRSRAASARGAPDLRCRVRRRRSGPPADAESRRSSSATSISRRRWPR